MTGALPLAHGLAGVRDLPVPLWLFYYGAGVALIVSFVALGALWRRPLLEARSHGRQLPEPLQRLLASAVLRALLGAVSAGLLALVFAAALLGVNSPAANLAPTFVYVLFWLGLVPVVVLLGDVWPVLNPWRAVADAVAWAWKRLGQGWAAPFDYPERLGRVPAAALLFLFVTLELAYPGSATPQPLALAIAVYSFVTWLGMLAFGRERWLEHGEAFTVYFGLLARLAPFAREEGRIVARLPLTGLARGSEPPGTVLFVAVMLGSVVFDGFSRTSWWLDRVLSIELRYAFTAPALSDLLVTLLGVAGLVLAVALVLAVYLAAVDAARAVGSRHGSLAADFAGSLIPIALAYAVAHYFTLFVIQGQAARRLVSDPFGWGWDLFGTADAPLRLGLLAPNTVWYVQVGSLVVGHVLGLVLAHDRAVALFTIPGRALRAQYALLALMVAYTVGGLWLLSNG